MNVLDLDKYLLIDILLFLTDGELFILIETCIDLYTIVMENNYLKTKKKIPDISLLVKNTKFLHWAKSHKNFKYTSKFTQQAIRRNNFKLTKYLFKDGCKVNKFAYSEAIHNNNFDILKWLRRRRIKITEQAFSHAAQIGNIKALKWLKKINCPYNTDTVNNAIKHSQLESLKFLIENGCDWNNEVFNYASESGNIKIIIYLYKEALTDLSKPWWNSSACSSAAKNGHLHILKFLKSKGCPWSVNTTYTAFEYKQYQTLVWAIENGCPVDESLYNLLITYGLIINTEKLNLIPN